MCCTSLKVTVIFGFCVQIAKVFMILWVHIVHILLYTSVVYKCLYNLLNLMVIAWLITLFLLKI